MKKQDNMRKDEMAQDVHPTSLVANRPTFFLEEPKWFVGD